MSLSMVDGTKAAMSHFNPSHSPVFTVAVAGSAAVLLTIEHSPLLFALPMFLVLIATLPLSFRSIAVDQMDADFELSDDIEERRGQRAERAAERWKQNHETSNFARALGVAGPLLALVFAMWTYNQDEMTIYFLLPYVVCLSQAIAFLGLMVAGRFPAARVHSQVQLALLASSFLLAAAVATNISASKALSESDEAPAMAFGSTRYDMVMAGFYLLWAVAIGCWAYQILRNWMDSRADWRAFRNSSTPDL